MKHYLLAALLLSGCSVPPAPSSRPQALTPQAPAAKVPVRPPLKLTAADGTGLELVKLESKAMVQGPLAFTELHLTFRNGQNRVLEGHFEITLPEGAALSRLAMLNSQGWQEGEVVEKQRARVAYEDALHIRQDPALLEQSAGNRFQCRIFPIGANANKEIILSYSQQLAPNQAYKLPLIGLPQVDDLAATARVWQGPGQEDRIENLRFKNRIPSEDFVVQRQAAAEGVIKNHLVMFSVKPKMETKSVPLDDLLVLVDTSASAGPHYQQQLSQLQQVLDGLKRENPGLRLTLAAFDQTVVPVKDVAELQKRLPMGASNWNRALHWAREQRGTTRVLLVGDGVITAGHERLSDFVPKLKKAGIARIDLLANGSVRNPESLRPLADALGGLVLDANIPVDSTVQALTHKALSGVAVEVEGAQWVWPQTLNGLRPGQESLVFAELQEPANCLKVSLSGPILDQTEVPLTSVAWPLLERAAAGARIARLTRECHDSRDEHQKNLLRRHVVELSTKFRVVSDFTALLVLENDWEYGRFGLDRRALANILVMGPQGLEVQQRAEVATLGRRADPFLGSNKDVRTEDSSAIKAGDFRASEDKAAGYSPSSGPLEVPEPELAGRAPLQGELRKSRALSNDEAPAPPKSDRLESFLLDPNHARPALTGEFAQIHRLLSSHQDARPRALAWLHKESGNVLAWVAYAQALDAAGQKEEAARAYGSIIDLYPGRADMRRYAGCCLESLGEAGQELAADSFTKAMVSRSDHPSSHRLLAFAELRLGHYQTAFLRLERGLRHPYPDGRFAGYQQVLRSDLATLGAAWAAHDPAQRAHIEDTLRSYGLSIDDKASTRFVLTWETDSSDVDLRVKDSRQRPASGHLLANVTTGYGPECFTIPGTANAFPYQMSIQYSARGPMGYGMGKVEVIQHDGHGRLRFAQKPYVVMNDQAAVDLGSLSRPL